MNARPACYLPAPHPYTWKGFLPGGCLWTDCQSDFQTILLLCSWAIVLGSIRGVDVWLCRGSLLTLEPTWHGHSLLSMQWGPLGELWKQVSLFSEGLLHWCRFTTRAWAHALFLSIFCSSPVLSSLTAHFLWLSVHLIIFNWIQLSGDTEVEPVSWQLWVSHSRMGHKGLLSGSSVYLCQHWRRGFTYRDWTLQGIGSYSLP